jgi:hypothetical protein
MIEKTKSRSRVGITLVGAFATIAGIGEIIVGLTGNCLGILAHPAGAPLVLALCRSKLHGFRLCSFSEAMALKITGRRFDRFLILRRRFGTIEQIR